MNGAAHRGYRGPGAWTLGLVALALLFRMLVPAGWMPGAGHPLTMTLCGGQTIAAPSALAGKEGPAHDSGHRADMPCAFAGLGAALLAPAAYAPLVALLPAVPAPPAQIAAAVGRGLAAPPPPPTGPPATL